MVYDMVNNNNNNNVSKTLIVRKIKIHPSKQKKTWDLFCPGWAQQTDKKELQNQLLNEQKYN